MSTDTSTPAVPLEIILEPGRIQLEYWKDLWRYRELFFFLAWRDVLVRYKQAFFGIAWAILRPLSTIIILTFVFGRVAKLPSEGTSYLLFVWAGLLPWQLFSTSMGESAESLIANSSLISKIYFPRMIIPASTILVNLFDFSITLSLFFLYAVWRGIGVTGHLIALPAMMFLTLCLSLGVGLLLSALNIRYRDFRYVIPFLLQIGLYLSPVGYATAVVPHRLQWLFHLNPMVGLIDGFRWCLLPGQPRTPPVSLLTSLLISTVLIWIGIRYFRTTERHFADII